MLEEKYQSGQRIPDKFENISKIQRIVFSIILFVIPWFVVPLPYDTTEKIKGILFIILSSILILLEIVKWIWDGKISIVKSPFDKAFLLFFFSFLISTIFARDRWMSFWGYDGRIGTSFIVILFLFLLFFLSRGFLKRKQDIVRAISSLSFGLFVLILISMLSVLKVNIFNWIPYIKEFFIIGLPLTFSSNEIILICGISIFINLFLLINFFKEEKYQNIIFPIVSLAISFISIPLFAVNQGILIPILFFIFTILICILLWNRLGKDLKALPPIIIVFAILSFGFSVGFQYDSFTKSVLGESYNPVTSIKLGSNISWRVASSSIVDNFSRGVIGLGNDSFGVAYNLYKPVLDSSVILSNTTFIVGSNELFTTLANRGLLGVVTFVLLIFVLLRLLIKQITRENEKKNVDLVLLGLTNLFVLVSSFFMPFSFLVFFLLFVLELLLVVLNNLDGNGEEFLLKFWAINTGSVNKDIRKTMNGINMFFTGFIVILTIGFTILLGLKVLNSAYVLRAEAYSIEMGREHKEKDIPVSVREEFLNRMAGYYDKALRYDSVDPYSNRRASMVSLDVINLLSEKYKSAKDTEKDALLSNITTWKNTAIDLSRKAVDTSPLTYANWNTRATVYTSLIAVGFSDYTEDALKALSICVNLLPLDYDSYYKAGQIYMIKEDYDSALAMFNRVLSINGSHIQSLVLSASIFNEKKDTKNAISYLKAAKQILETNKLEDSDTYKSIIESLDKLGANNEATNSENTSGEETKKTQ
mgnify:CR=1 FL=1